MPFDLNIRETASIGKSISGNPAREYTKGLAK